MPIIKKKVGIVAYGAAIPAHCLKLSDLEKANNRAAGSVSNSLKVEQKTVADLDEDAITLAIDAGLEALVRAERIRGFDTQKIQALFIGSESHPYAVKPSGTVVAQALGLSDDLSMADLQFACKAGTQGMQICASYVLSGFAELGLAIGDDVAQAKPGDILEYTAGAGAAAYVFGKQNLVARLLATNSVANDIPDFWRKAGESFPHHGGRFTGKPAYFKQVEKVTKKILKETSLNPEDFDFAIFHTPNGKFPRQVAKKLGFSPKQIKPGLVVEKLGNSYAASVPLALASVLDQTKAGQKILVVAYGSGAGADAFVFQATSNLPKYRKKWMSSLDKKIKQLKPIGYQ